MKRFAIIGGGFSGMQTALRLRKAGHDVTIFEAAPHLGGLADAWEIDSVTWDRHYHVILLSDLHVRELLAELGIEDQFVTRETRTGFYTDGELVSMSNSLEFLRFPPLGLISKFRLALTILHASRVRDPLPLESIPVVDWLRKWSGSATTEKIWLPLLRAKLGENYRHASAAFIWAIIARMYAARRSGLKKEMFGYVRGGYATIVDRFEAHLKSSGVDVRTGESVTSLRSDAGGVTVTAGQVEHFDAVVHTGTCTKALELCEQLSDSEADSLRAIRYQGIVCVSILLKSALAPYYVTNITDPAIPFTAVIEMTTLVDPAEFGGRHLIYLPKYVDPTDPIFDESDDSIVDRFCVALQAMYPHFSREDLVASRVSRVRRVFVIPSMNYSNIAPPVVTTVPNVYIVNSSQIVNGTLNINETLAAANVACDAILSRYAAVQPVEESLLV